MENDLASRIWGASILLDCHGCYSSCAGLEGSFSWRCSCRQTSMVLCFLVFNHLNCPGLLNSQKPKGLFSALNQKCCSCFKIISSLYRSANLGEQHSAQANPTQKLEQMFPLVPHFSEPACTHLGLAFAVVDGGGWEGEKRAPPQCDQLHVNMVDLWPGPGPLSLY